VRVSQMVILFSAKLRGVARKNIKHGTKKSFFMTKL